MIRISVIIPTKNEEICLPQLLDSVLMQDLPMEVIVADASSTDRTREIAASRGCRVILGGTLPFGRNAGAQASGASVLCFSDADMILPTKDYLSKALAEMNRRDLDFAGVRVRHARVGSNWKDFLYGAFYEISNLGVLLAEHTRRPYLQSLIFCRRATFDAIGGFPLHEFGEDSAFAKRAAALGERDGILLSVPPASISPRRLEKEGFWKALPKYLYFNFSKTFLDREFEEGCGRTYY